MNFHTSLDSDKKNLVHSPETSSDLMLREFGAPRAGDLLRGGNLLNQISEYEIVIRYTLFT